MSGEDNAILKVLTFFTSDFFLYSKKNHKFCLHSDFRKFSESRICCYAVLCVCASLLDCTTERFVRPEHLISQRLCRSDGLSNPVVTMHRIDKDKKLRLRAT